jgi:membrane protein DedA with SNARE-associated domain
LEFGGTAIFSTILAQVGAIIDNPVILFGLLFIFAAANLFFPPIPLETATLFAGYLSASGHGSPLIIITATVGGMFSASLILYQLTRKYGMALIEKSPLKNMFAVSMYQKTLHWFKRYGFYMIFLGKLVPGMTLYTVLCCGLLQLGITKVLWSVFLSNFLFFTALVMIGRELGVNWGNALPWLKQVGLVSLAVMVIFTVLALLKFIFELKRQPKE